MRAHPVRDAIQAAIALHGSMTIHEISAMSGLRLTVVKSCIRDGRRRGTKLFYIAGWGERTGACMRLPALWAVGSRKDANYPNMDRSPRDERYRQRQRMKKRIASVGAANPFASLIVQLGAGEGYAKQEQA